MLQIRESTYRGRKGWLVCGRVEGRAFPVRIFTETRESAERIKRKVKRGESVELVDFYL